MNRLIRNKKDKASSSSTFVWIVVGFAILMLVVENTTSGNYLQATIHRRLGTEVAVNKTSIVYGLGGMASLGPEDDIRLLSELTKSPPPGSLECPEGFTAIYDRVVDGSNSTTQTKIPKILHLSYKSRCLPAEVFGAGVQRWMDELPDYSVYFHDDDAVDRLLASEWQEFPHLHRIARCLQYKGAMKIDLWRMLVIYRFGGLYADIDNAPVKEFKNGKVIDPEDTFFASSDVWNRPNQNVFAMEAFHPIAVFTIATILKNLWELDTVRHPKVVFVTGPHAFKDGFVSFLKLTSPSKSLDEFMQPGITQGYLGKQIHKEPTWDWRNPIGLEQSEFNGEPMTKKERDHRLAGTAHWKKLAYWHRNGLDLSCRALLYQLDHPSTENTIAANWTISEG